MQWELIEGVTLTRRINEAVLPQGYCITLGGSVLYKGGSNKDLDLVMVPLQDQKHPYQAALEAVRTVLDPESTNVVSRVEAAQKLVFSLRLRDGRRVEIFFPNFKFSEVSNDVRYPAYSGKSSV